MRLHSSGEDGEVIKSLEIPIGNKGSLGVLTKQLAWPLGFGSYNIQRSCSDHFCNARIYTLLLLLVRMTAEIIPHKRKMICARPSGYI